jgi:transcription elongation factor Elf1
MVQQIEKSVYNCDICGRLNVPVVLSTYQHVALYMCEACFVEIEEAEPRMQVLF